MVWKCNKREKI